MPNRYDTQQNYLPAVPARSPTPSRRRQLAKQAADIANVQSSITVDAPLQTLEGSTEKTHSMDRARALVVRLAPFSAVWLTLAIGVSWWASLGGWFVLCLFSGLTAVTYAYLDRQEYQFSRNGLERHKVNTLASLKRDEMSHQQELRRMALEATLKMMETRNGNDY